MMWGGGWWVIGVLLMVACMYFMVQMMGHGRSRHGSHGAAADGGSDRSARDILAERFARGEISEEEFEQRSRVLERQPK